MFLFNGKKKKMIAEKINTPSATIIDVRTISEFNSGHVNGSINIPLDQIPNKIGSLKKMSRPLIICCRSGMRSGSATQFLTKEGFDEVYNGGAWQTVQKTLK